MSNKVEGFDRAAAVTRLLLGFGILAGPFYLTVGLILALTRDWFDFAKHPLSLLAVGDYGWIQSANFVLSGLMAIAAAVGFSRAMKPSAWTARLVASFGICVVAAALFPIDPMEGFPGGAAEEVSVSGALHMLFGVAGFLSLAAAAIVCGNWLTKRGDLRVAMYSRIGGAIVAVANIGGGIFATQAAGIALLWISVVTAWIWLGATSILLYSTVPHPDVRRRVTEAVDGAPA